MIEWPDSQPSCIANKKPEEDVVLAIGECLTPPWILHIGAYRGETTSLIAATCGRKIFACDHRWRKSKTLYYFFGKCWPNRNQIEAYYDHNEAIKKVSALGSKGIVVINGDSIVSFPGLLEKVIPLADYIIGSNLEDQTVRMIVGDAISGKNLILKTWSTAWSVRVPKKQCRLVLAQDAVVLSSTEQWENDFKNSEKAFSACRKPNGEFDHGVVLAYSLEIPNLLPESDIMACDRIYNYMPWIWPCRYQNGKFLTDDGRKIVILRTKAGTIKDCPKGLFSKPQM